MMAQCMESKSANVIRAKPFKWYFKCARHCSKHVIRSGHFAEEKTEAHIVQGHTTNIGEDKVQVQAVLAASPFYTGFPG